MLSLQNSKKVQNIARLKLALWGLSSFFFLFGFITALKFLSGSSNPKNIFNLHNAAILISSMFIVFIVCLAINKILSTVQKKMLYKENYNVGNIIGDILKVACLVGLTITGLSFVINLQQNNNLQLATLVEQIALVKTVMPENLLESFNALDNVQNAVNITELQASIAKLRETLSIIMSQAEKLKNPANSEKVRQIQQLMKDMQNGLDGINAKGRNVSIVVTLMLIGISTLFAYLIGCTIREFFSTKYKDSNTFIVNTNKKEENSNSLLSRFILSCTPTTYQNSVKENILASA